MDYKKKYEEALEWARKVTQGKVGFVLDEALEIFPELAESEDERIRKELLEHCKNQAEPYIRTGNKCPQIQSWITWLEKKGMQFPLQTNERAWLYLVADVLTWKDGIGQYLDDPRVQILAKKLCKEYAQRLYDPSVFHSVSNSGKIEQKSADRVKSKFKVGDWVAINPELHLASPLHIKYVDNNNYRVESANGTSGIPTINYLDRYYHLWTIEDAKDGDILASYNDENPFIFKGCIDTAHPNAPVAYCGIDNSNKFYNCINTSSWWTSSLVHPAEKVQRYFLFQKMREAGYEWDVDKKETKKIEQQWDFRL